MIFAARTNHQQTFNQLIKKTSNSLILPLFSFNWLGENKIKGIASDNSCHTHL
jgi:hypothetical protein